MKRIVHNINDEHEVIVPEHSGIQVTQETIF